MAILDCEQGIFFVLDDADESSITVLPRRHVVKPGSLRLTPNSSANDLRGCWPAAACALASVDVEDGDENADDDEDDGGDATVFVVVHVAPTPVSISHTGGIDDDEQDEIDDSYSS